MKTLNQTLSTLALIATLNLIQACSSDEASTTEDTAEAISAPTIVAGKQPDVEADGANSTTEAIVIVNEVEDTEQDIHVSIDDEEGPVGENIVNETAPRVYDEGCPADKTEWDMTPPVFKHIGIDLAPVDHATGWAGAFNFNDVTALGGSTRFFEAFGYQPPYEGYTPISDWIFATAPGTNVYSPLDGVVVYVAHNSNWDDYEVIINPRNCNKSFYFVTIDHIVDVTVAMGDRVVAGQVIGKKGADHNNGQYEGNARTFEITVGNANGEAFCPLNFFSPTDRVEAVAKLQQLVLDIETYVSPNPSINFNYLGDKFDDSAWVEGKVGCYMEMNTFVSSPVGH